MEELTAKIRSVIRDYPAVAYRLGFLQNTTTHKKLDTEQESETGAHLGRVEDERHGVVAVEEVLTVMDDGGPLGNDEREWSRGGFLDHDQAAGVVEEEGIINEVCSCLNLSPSIPLSLHLSLHLSLSLPFSPSVRLSV